MWALVHQQLYNAGEAMLTGDKELAYKVISRERRVNAFELKIDSDCEGYHRLVRTGSDRPTFRIGDV